MELENLNSGCSLGYFILNKNSESLLLDQLKENGENPSEMQLFAAKNAAEDRKWLHSRVAKALVISAVFYVCFPQALLSTLAIGAVAVTAWTSSAAVNLKGLFDAYALLQPSQRQGQGQAASLEKRVSVLTH